MLHHVPSWSSFSQGVMPGIHQHSGLSQQDEHNLSMQEALGEGESSANSFIEELEFDLLLHSTLMNAAWYAAPIYTYSYHEEDQFQDTLNYNKNRQDDLAPVNYNSFWSAPEIATPELKMSA